MLLGNQVEHCWGWYRKLNEHGDVGCVDGFWRSFGPEATILDVVDANGVTQLERQCKGQELFNRNVWSRKQLRN